MMEFDTLKSWVMNDWKAQADYREKIEDEFAFHDGHQWTAAEIADLEDKQRAAIVFNRVAPIIASVSGSEINNRTEVRFIPREIGDVKPNEILSSGAEWFRDEANAEDEDSQAFSDMLIAGLGWTETYLDFDADDEGAPRTMRIDPLEMCWDSHAHRKGLADATRVARVRSIPIEEARSMFPGVEDVDLNATWIARAKDEKAAHRNIIGDEYRDNENDADGASVDTVTIVQVQWRERVRSVEYLDPTTGKREEMPSKDWAKLKKQVGEMNIPNRDVNRLVWKQAFLGNTMLSESQPCKDNPTFQAITGHWDRKDKRFYGILRGMRDPQKFANKWLSQTLHIINTNAKGGVIVEEGAVSDMRDFEDSWAASDAVSWVKQGRSGSVIPKPGPQMPSALMQLTEFAISSIRDVSGVNMELMGMREAQQAGVLEYQRRQAAMTTLAFYFDSLRYYRKRQGQVILTFLIDWIAPTGRLVRILKDGSEQFMPLVMDEETRKYDVIVDDSPQAPNEKERTWSIIEKMMPLLQASNMSLGDWADILEYSPLPSSFAEKVRAKAEEQKAQPPQPDPIQQAEVAKTQSEAEENQSQTALNMARVQQIGMQAMMPPPMVGVHE